jgi:hypothetical protein
MQGKRSLKNILILNLNPLYMDMTAALRVALGAGGLKREKKRADKADQERTKGQGRKEEKKPRVIFLYCTIPTHLSVCLIFLTVSQTKKKEKRKNMDPPRRANTAPETSTSTNHLKRCVIGLDQTRYLATPTALQRLLERTFQRPFDRQTITVRTPPA